MPTPSTPDSFDDLLLERYLAGESTPRERAVVEAWAAAEPSRDAELETLRRARAAWEDLGGGAPTAAAWARLRDRVDAARHRGEGRVARRRPGRVVVFAFASAVVLSVCGTIWRIVTSRPAPQAFREFTTASGNRATITLRDGTRLVLAPATRLRVPSDFGTAADRTVVLDGEAYFAVVHDATHPFAVRTPRALIRDVGTTFVVHAYADDRDERVIVSDGEVRLNGASLRRNDLASVDPAGRIRIRHGVSVASYVAWTQGRLVFEDTPLRDAAREVERVFDVRVTVADSALGTELITAAFGDESVDEVLDVVTRTISARYERTGRAVVIRRRHVPAGRLGSPPQVPLSTAQATAHADGPRP